MIHTLAFLMALPLAPAQAGDLKITNVRSMYSMLGPARSDDRLLPGDIYYVSFDTEGMMVGDNGQVYYSIGMELRNSANTVIFSQEPTELGTVASLGGSTVPMFANITIGGNQKPGDYKLTVKIQDLTKNDKKAPRSVRFSRKFEVRKPRFGIVRLLPALDPGGSVPAPTTGVVGQTIWLRFWIVGFKRGANMQPNLLTQLEVLDEDGKPTLRKPSPTPIQKLEADKDIIPAYMPLALNRPGKFKVRLRATDKNNRDAHFELAFPITVTAAQ